MILITIDDVVFPDAIPQKTGSLNHSRLREFSVPVLYLPDSILSYLYCKIEYKYV